MEDFLISRRKSYIEIGFIYLWTATINNWNPLLKEDRFKDIIVDSLSYLSSRGLADIFTFVIMPNHIHLIWRINSLNGKETVQASFLKFTAHAFKKRLKELMAVELKKIFVASSNIGYEFWQHGSLAIPLYNKKVAIQKLLYIHKNPLSKHWSLAPEPTKYYYSSLSFYELDERQFPFIKHLMDEF